MNITILGIESSCDDTSAAVLKDNILLSNIIAGQEVHNKYGGVVPELASRAHQQNIVPVVDMAIKEAGIGKKDISAIAFTRGPGLLGSLLVGTSFAKGFALGLNIPIIEVNHLQAHVLAHFVEIKDKSLSHPKFPFICLLVSGGHSQLILVEDYLKMTVLGQTLDDAAGEAFDKCAKVMGLGYPGGPEIDKLARKGDPFRFKFTKPKINMYNYSFSGLKTGFLYFLKEQIEQNPDFIEQNKADLAASLQHTIIEILTDKLILLAKDKNINEIAVAGGVSANSGLRKALLKLGEKNNWNVFLPELSFTTDNAAMIAMAAFFKYKNSDFTSLNIVPKARYYFNS